MQVGPAYETGHALEKASAREALSAGNIPKDLFVKDMKIVDGFRLRDVMGQATVIGEGVNQVNFNKLITLNASAAFLWRQVEGKEFDVETLKDLLVSEYGIDVQLAEKDAEAIANKWVEAGIVK